MLSPLVSACGFPPCNIDAPEVPAINVILIRRKNHRAVVGAERHIFHLESSRSEQRSRAAGCGDGVKMIPAILLRRKQKPVVADEVERFVGGF